MRYLQTVGTVIVVLLAIISFQLHQARPFTAGDYQRARNGDEDFFKIIERMPAMQVDTVHRDISVRSVESLGRIERPVSVDTVGTGGVEIKK